MIARQSARCLYRHKKALRHLMKRPADYFSETNEFDNGKHAALWKRTLVTCASPIIGSKLITDYTFDLRPKFPPLGGESLGLN